ncbi:MmgE/PrpD family protein [Lentibacter algarum]|uniref:MmgE/PrpD family protein n=1 Tax=Lentibacter algarum TaxID=576131 RepID=UPI001C07455B|nr:MmgE/PrpD family protein [Lentibacter algarum]MBU2982057.1 MmgE/PrpD family protein [Lentibacter algarum]
MTKPLTFIHALQWQDIAPATQAQTKLSLLDLIGVAAGGTSTRLSQIIAAHASEEWGGTQPLLFSPHQASASGAALAGGMLIDSLDGHDGFNPAKGHIGCPLFSAALAIGHESNVSGAGFLASITMGYEFGARASVAQHRTVPDYHTSGSWGAVTAAAACAKLLKLSSAQTRHALGIAEYHGPRSQMMRCIDHPTMLKDGSGWGAMTGVSATKLALRGFTGAPAITVENAPEHWKDLGQRWYVHEQYYKPYPVCRWAQAPIEAALSLLKTHSLTSQQVDKVTVETFHESVRLATSQPKTTEEAQYSTSFPVAVAIARGDVTPADIADDALNDPEILRLSRATEMREHEHANAPFPLKRLARVTLTLTSGATHTSDWMEPKWDHTAPPTEAELREKYHNLADPVLGLPRANAIEDALEALDNTPLSILSSLLLAKV